MKMHVCFILSLTHIAIDYVQTHKFYEYIWMKTTSIQEFRRLNLLPKMNQILHSLKWIKNRKFHEFRMAINSCFVLKSSDNEIDAH